MDGAQDSRPSRRPSTKRSYSTMADSHREHDESSSSLFLPAAADDHYSNEQPSRRPRLTLPPRPSFVQRRYPDDGLDHRRSLAGSVTWPAPMDVIDLTVDDDSQEPLSRNATGNVATASAGSSRLQRLPRFGRSIIDGDDDETRPSPFLPAALRPQSHRNNEASSDLPRPSRPQFASLRRPSRFDRPPSPPPDMDEDIEIVSERPLSRPQTLSRQPTPGTRALRSVTPYPTGFGDEPIDLTNDDEVVHLNTRPRERDGGINAGRPGATAGLGTRSEDQTFRSIGFRHIADILRGDGPNRNGRLWQRLAGRMSGDLGAQIFEHFHVDHDHADDDYDHETGPGAAADRFGDSLPFAAPPRTAIPGFGAFMNYEMVGFDLGLGGNRPPTPKYSPPPAPDEGFTRDPGEHEIVVCPNCGDELAMGDSEVKQQVWVIKGCGHAYCGECAHNRNRSARSSGKGKGKAPDLSLPAPFKVCVVEECKKSAAAKNMLQVYLGS